MLTHGVPADRVGPRWAPLPSLAVVATLLVVGFLVGGDLWFFSDDWNIFAGYHSGNLLEPFNGHLSLVPAGSYQAIFQTLGVGSYMPFRLVGLAALGVLGYQVCRTSVRAGGWVVGMLATTAVIWNSSGETNVLFPFLLNFSLPLAALLGCWWNLGGVAPNTSPATAGTRDVGPGEPDGPVLRRRAIAMGLWLALALATSGLGVVVAVALAVELAGRRAPRAVWIAWATPVLLWTTWWLGHRSASNLSLDPTVVLPYAARMVLAGATALGAGVHALGLLVLAALAAALTWGIASRRVGLPRLAAALCALAAFCGLTAMTRQDTVVPVPPDELRYGWTVGALLVFSALALLDGPVAPADGGGRSGSASSFREGVPGRVPALGAVVVASCVLLGGAVVLAGGMRDWAGAVHGAAPGLRSNIYAAEALGADRVPPDAVLGPLSYVPVNAREYLGGVEDVGSPLQGSTVEMIGGRPEQRAEADRFFFDNVGIREPTPLGADAGIHGPQCASQLEALPGARIVLTHATTGSAEGGGAAGSEGGTLRAGVSRFDPALAALQVTSRGPGLLEIPRDAVVGTTAVVPYRLTAGPDAVLCPYR